MKDITVQDFLNLISKDTNLTRMFFFKDGDTNMVNNPYVYSDCYIHSITLHEKYGFMYIAVSDHPKA